MTTTWLGYVAYFGTWLGPGNGLHLDVYLVMPWICGYRFCHLVGSGSDLDMSLMYFGFSLTCETIWTCNSEWIYDVMNEHLLGGCQLISICCDALYIVQWTSMCIVSYMCHVRSCRSIWQQYFTTISLSYVAYVVIYGQNFCDVFSTW
jgi:hypothetical protein